MPALVVSVLALAFTVGAFWWLQARKGRLRSFAPQSFAGVMRGKPFLNLPLALHNTGATPIVVQDFSLRLDVPKVVSKPIKGFPLRLSWVGRQGQLEPLGPITGGLRVMPSPFSVKPRDVLETFIEFGTYLENLDLTAVTPLVATVRVRATGRGWVNRLRRKDDSEGWSELLTFNLYTDCGCCADDPTALTRYIAHTNDPQWMG